MTINIEIMGEVHNLELDQACQTAINAADGAKRMTDGVYPNVARIGGDLQLKGYDRTGASDWFKAQERDWKKMREMSSRDTTLPNPWTSAKSVVLKAIEVGVVLCDDAGNPRGKTDVQKELAETKATSGEGEKAKETPIEACVRAVKLLSENYAKLGEEEQSHVREAVRMVLA